MNVREKGFEKSVVFHFCGNVTLEVRPPKPAVHVAEHGKPRAPEDRCEVELDLFTNHDVPYEEGGWAGLLTHAYWEEAIEHCIAELHKRHPGTTWQATHAWTRCKNGKVKRPYMGMTFSVTKT